MDDAITEMLSRFIDGDLDPAEKEILLGKLNMEPVLRSRLEALQRLRSSLSSLAENEEVPPDLDALVEPLRRARPNAAAARPWVRWLATAAAAVLGLSVILEVSQRSSRPPVQKARRAQTGSPAEPTERFSLAPLPTSGVPPEDQLLGVSERLLASPIPEIEIEDSPALQVLGPLEAPPGREDVEGGRKAETVEPPATISPAAVDASVDSPRSDMGKAASDRGESLSTGAPVMRKTVPASEKRSRRVDPRQPSDGEATHGQAQLFVFINGETSWRDFEPRTRCDTGRYAVRIRVADGVVREVWPVGRASSDQGSPHLCAGELIRGLPVEEVPDGEYAAEVVIEPRGAGTD
jgi:hypothetical protein